MANLTLTDKELRSRRFMRYVTQMQLSRAEALGKLLFFWDCTRALGIVQAEREMLQAHIDGDQAQQRHAFDVLLGCGYISATQDGLYAVDGNAQAVQRRQLRCDLARRGGLAKAHGPARVAPVRRPARAPVAPKAPVRTAHAQACHDTWMAYAQAYQAKTTRLPLRNAKVNAQIKQLVQRVGAENAPGVARFYVEQVTDPYYTKNVWPLGALLAQAEGFVTQWQTGRTFSHADAQSIGASADYYRRQQMLAQAAAGLEYKDELG